MNHIHMMYKLRKNLQTTLYNNYQETFKRYYRQFEDSNVFLLTEGHIQLLMYDKMTLDKNKNLEVAL